MFDADTVALIRQAPALEGLDLSVLPQDLTRAFTAIVTTRMRLQESESEDGLPPDIAEAIQRMRRLAVTHEALVVAAPDRSNRAAAAFVAASAHQVCYLADRLRPDAEGQPPSLTARAVAPEVAATLLFLIAASSADAMEMAKRIHVASPDSVEAALLLAIVDLASGRLSAMLERDEPDPYADDALSDDALAVRLLWAQLLSGVRALGASLLGPRAQVRHVLQPGAGIRFFEEVKALSIEPLAPLFPDASPRAFSLFAGPHHLASLLAVVAGDLAESALIRIPSPPGMAEGLWQGQLYELAGRRPYLWPNHREAITAGYLVPGNSVVTNLPTGAGKSTLAELKIATALLRGKKVIYLAPTLALVDQVSRNLQVTFPRARVQHESTEDGGFSDLNFDDELPAVGVMTPEHCLAMLSFSDESFQDVGLLVFDECHLLHPREVTGDRRSLDAMLCLLKFMEGAPGADLLLLSAMMKNAEEIAGWIADLSGRPCLPFISSWKPTRQARGCVVFDAERIRELESALWQAFRRRTTKGVPAALKRQLTAIPAGLFCLRQTWQTKEIQDYSLLRLNEDAVLLGTGNPQRGGSWYLTPNRNAVAAAIAANAGASGIKTIVFAQTVPMCDSAVELVAERLPARAILLTAEEQRLFDMAVEDAGGDAYVYASPGRSCAPHHGLLLPAERHLHESLFRRRDGIDVLVATSTLAQGMNLPSELVIIAGDDRFDANTGRAAQLEAHELLNAAGRAGRAGEAAQGLVIVVPGKVIDFDSKTLSIDRYWHQLQTIFEKSDQCLDIRDPIGVLLDRIQIAADDDLTAYFLRRLPVGEGNDPEPTRALLARSFAAYQAGRQNDTAWLQDRLAVAMARRQGMADAETTWHDRIAAASGISADLVRDLDRDMHRGGDALGGSAGDWITWILDWMALLPSRLADLVRPSSLEDVFGKPYQQAPSVEEKCRYALDQLRHLLPLWVGGATLRDIELAMGTPVHRIGHCECARSFALRLVPELAYAFGIPAQVHRQHVEETGSGVAIPLSLATLGNAVRDGFDAPEKLALHRILRRKVSRVGVHRRFGTLASLLAPGDPYETMMETMARIRRALSSES